MDLFQTSFYSVSWQHLTLWTTPSFLKHSFALASMASHSPDFFPPASPADFSQHLSEASSSAHSLNVGVLQGFDLGLPFFILHTDDGLLYPLPWLQLPSICRLFLNMHLYLSFFLSQTLSTTAFESTLLDVSWALQTQHFQS